MGMIDLSTLKSKLETLETQEEVKESSLVLLQQGDLPVVELTDSEEINAFLQNKYFEYINLAQGAALKYGRLLENVFQKLKEFDGEITYCKFLNMIGTNRMTALRYRRRAKLFDSIQGEYKKIALLFRDDFIAKIYALNDFEGVVSFINDGATKEDLEEWIAEVSEEKKEIRKTLPEPIQISFSVYKEDIFNNFNKIETLDYDKQIEVEKYLKKIDKILKGE